MEGFFLTEPPHPCRIPFWCHTFIQKIAHPIPLGIYINLPWGEHGYFLALHNSLKISNTTIILHKSNGYSNWSFCFCVGFTFFKINAWIGNILKSKKQDIFTCTSAGLASFPPPSCIVFLAFVLLSWVFKKVLQDNGTRSLRYVYIYIMCI